MLHRRTPKARRQGVTIVETALVVAVFLLFLFGLFEYGRYIMLRQLLDNAAREGARLAIIGTTTKTTQDIQNQVNTALVSQQQAFDTVTIQVYKANAAGNSAGTWNSAALGERIAVQVDATYKPLIPTFGILPSTVSVRAKSVMRSEAP